jgi:hypothetical protein
MLVQNLPLPQGAVCLKWPYRPFRRVACDGGGIGVQGRKLDEREIRRVD